ncbi:MAG: DUF2953 domain-containing protein [Pseudomonadota bacterium]
MWTFLTLLLWMLAAVCALLLVALVSPLRLEFRAAAGKAARFSLALRPFGRFGPRLTVADSDRPPKKKKPKPGKKKAKPARTTFRDPKRALQAAIRLIADIFGQLHIHNAALDLRFGAGDPAETGEIYGALTPFIYGTAGSRRVHMNVEPVFDAAMFDGRAALDITLTPARLLPPFARFGWALFGPVR